MTLPTKKYFTWPVLASVIIVALCASLISLQSASFAIGSSCSVDATVVFARGSNEKIDGSFYKKVSDEYLDFSNRSHLSFNFYELGEDSSAQHSYPAVSIDPWTHFDTMAGAKLSSGYALAYGESVREGVNELSDYLSQSLRQCPNSQFILAGYSQGAQVIGDALQSKLGDNIRAHVVFVSLFGDPKLFLPEGVGFLTSRRCADNGFSNWRRDTPNCFASQGSLGARMPYLSYDTVTLPIY